MGELRDDFNEAMAQHKKTFKPILKWKYLWWFLGVLAMTVWTNREYAPWYIVVYQVIYAIIALFWIAWGFLCLISKLD